MGHLAAVGVEIEAAVVARGGQPALPQPDPLLKVFAVAHVAVEGGFHPDPPRLARAIDAPAADLAADVHDVVLGAEPFDQLRQQIDRVALGHRIEVELHAGVALHQPPAFDADLFAAHEIEDRIDVRMRLGRLAGESPRLDERLDRHVVTPPAQRPDAVRQAEVEGDMAIDAVRLVAVQPAQQRRRIENRHRGLGLAVQLHDGRV